MKKCTFINDLIINDCLLKLVIESISVADLMRKLGHPQYVSGRKIIKMREMLIKNSIDISHFSANGSRKTGEYKKCPVCGEKFYSNNSMNKKVCSRSCSNIFFPRAPITQYRTICFKNHKEKCIICGEDLMVDVHHYDGDHENNDPKNLVPICATHHRYLHSRYMWIIKECVDEYVENFSPIGQVVRR